MWDNRFHISTSKSNQKIHEYYRAYFDKPPQKKQERILLTNKPKDSYPNLHASLEKFSRRMPKRTEKVKVHKELRWVDNFHVKTSKDNLRFYKDCREYFDSPVQDIRSSTSLNRRSPLISITERTSKPSISTEKFYWSSLYEPVSERNIVKHRSQRLYFS